jgi:iron complex transport system substrate-binding protein
MRIVSLLASGTEIVCALGAGDALVGRSHECDNPEWVRTLPACTRPAFDVRGSSAEIDAEVRRRLKSGEPLYHVDSNLIRELEPDVLITQVHCEVCAVTPRDVARAGCATPAAHVVALSAGTVAGIYDGIRNVARALGREAAADGVIGDMQRRMDAVTRSVSDRPAPSVALLEWTEPVFAAANWAPELIEAAGGRPVGNKKGEHSTPVPWQQIVDADPDYIVVAPCGFDLDRTMREAAVLECLPGWFDLAAVRNGRVAFADGNKYFNRSGMTIVETVEVLAEILHPDCGQPRWHGLAWREYSPWRVATGGFKTRRAGPGR